MSEFEMPMVIVDISARRDLAAALSAALSVPQIALESRQFPDGEHYVRLLAQVSGCQVILLADLRKPDEAILPIIFIADLLHEMGATKVLLVVPYLAYMRQDIRFKPGEAISSRSFARLLSQHVDALLTIDPHLHRYHALSEIYSIPALAMSSVELIAAWIREHVDKPILIGPDAESSQWVEAVARLAGAPATVLHKTRHGDRAVEVSAPPLDDGVDHTPILVDDIVSSGHTLLETLHHLQRGSWSPAVCIAVHGLFAEDSYAQLKAAGTRAIVTCNTVQHASNGIDITSVLVQGIRQLSAPKEYHDGELAAKL